MEEKGFIHDDSTNLNVGDASQVHINGSGQITGDVRGKSIQINGTGKITGSVESETFHISGTSKVLGSVRTNSLVCHGYSTINGGLVGEEVKVTGVIQVGKSSKIKQLSLHGHAKFEEDLEAHTLYAPGILSVQGNFRGHQLQSFGSLQVQKDCEVEEFKSRGVLKINGLLNAETIEIMPYTNSKIQEIGGQNIKIQYPNDYLFQTMIKKFFDWSGILEVDVIEGEEIYLECTKAKIVRGNRITIGRNCQIESVEYKDSLEILENAHVDNQQKMND
ncbi:Polymer-forming protein [Seinonella peptonophila]|uniref:Polymer-forming protein n=1 Tax=Seinonella peptonophila TaxID=112248 RepID=A0A1M4TTG0_9BACL|nr:polymer-forming cytoskeletal protein [Seinonella peptonophila]SHE47733.1 Polymer-forming protein [Seinonella peptonophila]